MLIPKRPIGRPKTKDVWSDRVERLLLEHAKAPDMRRFRQSCEGYTRGQIATRELISSETVKGSISRCRAIIRHGKMPRTKVQKKIVAVHKCELCQKGNGIIWTE